MRTASPGFIAGLTEAPTKGIKPRRFLWVRAFTRSPSPLPFDIGVWTGDRDVNVTLMDGQTGALVNRTYYGMGKKLNIPSIPRVSDMTIQTISCRLSQLSVVTQTLVRENNVRFAKVDIHEGLLNTRTKLLLSNPEIVFLGEVDGDPIETPRAGGVGSISLSVVSDAIRALTLTNPQMRSFEAQKQRGNDLFGTYSGSVKNFEFDWGENNSVDVASSNAANKGASRG